MDKQLQTNPWKGLQSYQENDVIFGRDDEINNLYTRVSYSIQTVVYGKSGIGKSSIINAGIIPRAKFDGMLPVHIRLAHTTKKDAPSTEPYIEQIKNRIEEELKKVGGELEDVTKSQSGKVLCEEEPRSLWELLHRYRLWVINGEVRKRLIPLLLFDQFEEIFTLETDKKRVDIFFSELADLLNEVKPDYLYQSGILDNTYSGKHLQTDTSKDENAIDPNNIFCDILNRESVLVPEYLEKSEFHVVITLREDFLPDLERHTIHIPIMKTNRFSILPLNEEQAAKIIMEPLKGLISKSVAKEIIQKVTGRTDFQLDGIPEIEVNASLLSLYMERLYNKKPTNEKSISSEMVVEYGDNIIKEFYEESIDGIPDDIMNILEDELLTNEDKRDNVARINLNAKVDDKYIKQLLDKKVLQEFKYNGVDRVELIHDVLCPIVNKRISNREQMQEQKQKLKRSRRNTIVASCLAALAMLSLFYVTYIYINKPTTVIEDNFVDVLLVFNPDETLTDDPWEADVNINALNDSIMTLLNTSKLVEGVLHIKGPGSDTIMVRMLMDDVERPFDITVNSRTGGLCAERKDRVRLEKPNADSLRSVTWAVTLTRDPQAMYTLMGNIATKYGTPIYDAFVVLGDKIARTDNMGNYAFRMNDSTELMGSVLHVFKGEYESEAINGEDILKYMHAKQIDSYNITLKTRPEYDSLYINELTITDKIVNRTGHLNAKDSSFINTYFGNDYFIKHTKATSPDTVFYYVFRQVRNKNSEMQGRVFGYYLHKKNKKPFTGYVEEIERDGKLRRWKISLTAHDSIFNKERITGIIHGDYIDLKY